MAICKSCAKPITGNYCTNCGEKVINASDRSIKHFLPEFVNLLTFADSKLFRTVKLLLFKPGELTKNYVEGRRIRFMRPLQLFFLANLLYFLFPYIQIHNTPLKTQMNGTPYSQTITKLVDKKLEKESRSLEEYSATYNSKSTEVAKLLLIFLAVLYSFPLWLFHFKKRNFYSDHLLFGIEFLSFNIVVNALLLTLALVITSKIAAIFGTKAHITEFGLTLFMVVSWLYFIVRGFYNFYNDRLWIIAIKGLAFVSISGYLTVVLYRFILFSITFWLV